MWKSVMPEDNKPMHSPTISKAYSTMNFEQYLFLDKYLFMAF